MMCVQPIAVVDGAYADILPGFTINPVDGRQVDLVPLQGNTVSTPAEDDTACLPQVGFEQYVAEVDLERLNLARTNDEVLWKKLDRGRGPAHGCDRRSRSTVPVGSPTGRARCVPDYAAIYAARLTARSRWARSDREAQAA